MIKVKRERKTNETDIRLVLGVDPGKEIPGSGAIRCGLPFFEHMLAAMAFHGGFSLELEAEGDIEVDPHHLVEDCGLVLGAAIYEAVRKIPDLRRFATATVPMDDALVQTVVDLCGRPWFATDMELDGKRAGGFSLELIDEFFAALSGSGRFNLHMLALRGRNGHHLAEAAFKSLGRALGSGMKSTGFSVALSTKGVL